MMGPKLVAYFSARANDAAVRDLAVQVDSAKFEQAFGAGLAQLDQLIEEKTVTIARLMEIAPPGTLDPAPYAFNDALLTAAGLT